jgi:outer membrane receptor protein involved in Fe transport
VSTAYQAAVRFRTGLQAVFGEATYRIAPRLNGTLGLRYSSQKEHDVTLTQLPAFGLVIDQSDLTKTFTNISPKVGASYAFRDRSLFFGNIAKGYRAGGTNPLHASNANAPLSFDADTLWSYELGMKTSTRDGRISGDATIFYMDWDNLQIEGLPENSLLGFTTNAGRARSEGAELELHSRPAPDLELTVGGAYTNAILKEAAQGGMAGNQLPFVPRLTTNVAAQYEHPLGRALSGLLRADYRWRDKTYREVTNDPLTAMRAYGLTNVRAGVEATRWGAYVFINNATNVRADLDRNARFFFYRNEPRTVGVTFRIRPVV